MFDFITETALFKEYEVYIMTTLYVLAIMIPLFVAVAYTTWLERKVIGAMQVRVGPRHVGPYGLFQPWADMFKLIFKEIILPAGANKVLFVIAPVITEKAGPFFTSLINDFSSSSSPWHTISTLPPRIFLTKPFRSNFSAIDTA